MKLSNVCTRVDLDVYQGATFGPMTHQLYNADGSAYNLTGCIFIGQIRKTQDATVPVASFTFANPAPTLGAYTFSLPAAASAAIVAGNDPDDGASSYVYDISMITPAAGTLALLRGKVRMFAEVARA